MAHPIAPDYGQQFLLPPALEDWVSSDHPARFLREFVDQMDLGLMGFVIPQSSEGRRPYAPSLLLKIWLYGYFHRIRSTRKLEEACREQLPLLWLCGLIAPDHNSLWRFWRDNKKALRGVFKQTVQVALNSGCVGLALQALDGTKIQAAGSGRSGRSKKQMEKVLAALEGMLDQTELKIAEENSVPAEEEPVRLPAGLAQREALRQQIQKGLAQLAADKRKHHHSIEPEARRMKIGGGKPFAYNAQALADAKEGIIVACETLREESDEGQLVPMIEQARQNLGPLATAAESVTVADTGYGAGADLQAASQKQMAVLVVPREGKPTKDNAYATQYFTYDEHQHSVSCPQGRTLDYEGHTHKEGVKVQRFRCHCRDCPVRAQCTRDPKGRQIEVWPHTAVVQGMRQRLRQPASQALWRQRREIIERRFGQIKQHDGLRRWTVWGLEAVRIQWSLLCATLNLRVIYKYWKEKPVNGRAAALAVLRHGAQTLLRVMTRWLEAWRGFSRYCGATGRHF
jgi:transposase